MLDTARSSMTLTTPARSGWRLHFFPLDASGVAVLNDAGVGKCGPGDPTTFQSPKFIERSLRPGWSEPAVFDRPNDWWWFFDL